MSDYSGLVEWLDYRNKVKIQEAAEADPGHPKENALKEAERYRAVREAIAALSSVPGASYFTWKHKNEDEEHRGFGKHHPGFKDDSGYVVDPLYLATPPAPQTALALIEELERALEPFVHVRDQFPQSMALIQPKLDGLTPIKVTITKDQFLAAITALASAKRFKEGA